MNKKILNGINLEKDLRDYLMVMLQVYDNFYEVVKWLDGYKKLVESNLEELVRTISEQCPDCYVKVHPSPDGCTATFVVDIYGFSGDKKDGISQFIYDLNEKSYSEYCLLCCCHDEENTKAFYPDEWEEVQKIRNYKRFI